MTLLSVTNASFVYLTAREMRTPRYSEHFDLYQWCPVQRGSTVYICVYTGTWYGGTTVISIYAPSGQTSNIPPRGVITNTY